jgi:osmoprotectant transport system ATP-binding protein
LTLDDALRPIGWIDRAASTAELHPAAGFRPDTDTLRTALDAAVLSPAGVAVALGTDGLATGTASREAILAALAPTDGAPVGLAKPNRAAATDGTDGTGGTGRTDGAKTTDGARTTDGADGGR